MKLNQLIKDAAALAVYNNGDIPLMMFGKEVDITLTEKIFNGNHNIEVNFNQILTEKPRVIQIVDETSPVGEDCSRVCVVLGAEGMKVRDFIAYICEKYNNVNGAFCIHNIGIYRYNNGSIDAKSLAHENFVRAMDLTINNIKALGVRASMDYEIDCNI